MRRLGVTLLLLLFAVMPQGLFAQDFVTVSGVVKDVLRGTPLHYASVTLEGTHVSNVTNEEGCFSLKVPVGTDKDNLLIISYLGYNTWKGSLAMFLAVEGKSLDINMVPMSIELDPATVRAIDPLMLLRTALYKVRDNYPQKHVGLTAFYREMIVKGKTRYLTLNEAIIDIDKAPYGSYANDKAGIYKGRGSVNYDTTDTLLINYQGGVMATLSIDPAKNPFAGVSETMISNYYDLEIEGTEVIDSRLCYVLGFDQKKDLGNEILYRGKVYIDSETYAICRMDYAMNVENRPDATSIFILKKPSDTRISIESATFLANFKISDGLWYYDYARIELKFKAKRKRWPIANQYTVMSELAVTDHKKGEFKVSNDSRVKFRDQLSQKVAAFTDDAFWENYNVIEPDQTIETIIRRIVKQLKKHNLE